MGHGHRTVEVGDSSGNHDTTQTDGNGYFSMPTTTVKTPPYLLRITTSAPTTTLYSVSADADAATTINITPLTDLIIRSWYSSQTPSVAIEAAFANPVTYPAPKPESVFIIHSLVKNVVQLWLDKNGVTTSDFNLISTPFTAGTSTITPLPGLDAVLHQAWVNAATGQIVISNGTTTQSSTLNAFLSSLTSSNTTVSQVTGSILGSGNNDLTSIPTTTVMQDALAGINAMLTNMTNSVNARGLSLVYSDLRPYIDQDPAMQHNGANRDQLAMQLAAKAREAFYVGKTKSYKVKAIYSMNTNTADIRITGAGMPNSTLKKDSGSWLLSGNGRSGNVMFNFHMVTQQGAPPNGSDMEIACIVQAPPGKVTAVTLDGGGIWSNSTNSVHDTKIGPYGSMDNFYSSSTLTSPLPKGTPFTVMLTTPTGTESYTVLSNAYTTEPIRITNLTGTGIATVTPGSELTVSWTKPNTFAVEKMGLGGQAWNGSGIACLFEGMLSDPAVPAGKITVPSTCNGSSVVKAHIYVNAMGVNGELSSITYRAAY